MLALCKNQKWKEKVKINEYRKFGDLIPKSMAFVKVLKTENLTKNIWEFYVGRALPCKCSYILFKNFGVFLVFKNLTTVTVFNIKPPNFQNNYTNFDLLFPPLAFTEF